jgi:sorbose reductase
MIRLGVRGSILFTASISGIGACAGNPHYGVSKAGVISLMQSMAIELVRYGIRVNSVSPGAARHSAVAPPTPATRSGRT